jgi:hypothetical protein
MLPHLRVAITEEIEVWFILITNILRSWWHISFEYDFWIQNLGATFIGKLSIGNFGVLYKVNPVFWLDNYRVR